MSSSSLSSGVSALPEGVASFVIRIKVNDEVFYVAPEALREEFDGLRYQGFGSWKGGPSHRAVAVADLNAVQKDLRLHVCMPDDEVHFCDLTQDEVNADPYRHLAKARETDDVLWEFDPAFDVYKPATTPQHLLDAHADALEAALFD